MHDEGSLQLDLLLVGGLTIDRYADGSRSPGGGVVHVTRAASRAGFSVGAITVAGSEPRARAGLDELRANAVLLRVRDAPFTIGFRHDVVDDQRRLILERPGTVLEAVPGGELPAGTRVAAVLFAPVAGEVGSMILGVQPAGALRGAILQGWVRSLERGRPVRAIPLAAIPEAVAEQLGMLDLLVASVEDLAAEGSGEPKELLSRLRARFGARPSLAVTDGRRGAWLDIGGARFHVPPPTVVDSVLATGAGDVFAATLLVRLARGDPPRRGAAAAARIAAAYVAAGVDTRDG